MGVLRAAVHQHELGGRGAPDQAADLAARTDLDIDPSHRRRSRIGKVVLGGILREETELVVRHHVPAQ
jgi:hypothetical protein